MGEAAGRTRGYWLRFGLILAVYTALACALAWAAVAWYAWADDWMRGFAVGLLLTKPLRDGFDWLALRAHRTAHRAPAERRPRGRA